MLFQFELIDLVWISIIMPSLRSLLRRQLRKIPGVVPLWRLIKKMPRYRILRLVGHATFPIFGRQMPLRGYYARMSDYLKGDNGYSIDLGSRLSTDRSAPSHFAAPESLVAVVPRGRSLYDCGVVVSPDHRLLADVSGDGESPPQAHFAMHKILLPPVRRIAGKVAVMSALRPNNYYHWMFDILPRFELLQTSGLDPDYYLINTEARFQKETLRILGIPADRIVNPTPDTHVEADELFVPSLRGPTFRGSPQFQACRYLRSTFLGHDAGSKPHRALYVTRSDAHNRRVVNEREIEEELLDFGFEVVSLTGVPFLRQVELFSQARIVVGPHGAGFTNAVFCQPGSTLIEFWPQGHTVDCFKRLAGFVGMEYHVVVGTKSNGGSDGYVAYGDHVVDRGALRSLLRQVA